MDTLNIITAIYKNELSKVNDEKIVALELRIEELENK